MKGEKWERIQRKPLYLSAGIFNPSYQEGADNP